MTAPQDAPAGPCTCDTINEQGFPHRWWCGLSEEEIRSEEYRREMSDITPAEGDPTWPVDVIRTERHA